MRLRVGYAVMTLVLVSSGCAGNSGPTDASVTDFPSLVAGLREMGLGVSVGAAASQPFFGASGRAINVSGEAVQVFEYGTEGGAAADAAQVAPDGGTIGTTSVLWVAPPHFFRKGRLIVLYVGESPSITRALTSLLGRQFAGR